MLKNKLFHAISQFGQKGQMSRGSEIHGHDLRGLHFVSPT